jgi:hypothetical protein
MFIAYNLRRILNILTMDVLKEYLRILYSLFQEVFDLSERICRISESLEPAIIKNTSKNHLWLKTA